MRRRYAFQRQRQTHQINLKLAKKGANLKINNKKAQQTALLTLMHLGQRMCGRSSKPSRATIHIQRRGKA